MIAPVVMCIDDQREVLGALVGDLQELSSIELIECESVSEAWEMLDELQTNGKHLALILCDHIMPGTKGIDFLIELFQRQCGNPPKTALITGLASHQDTIAAINQARICCYIAKPWNKQELLQTVRSLLTSWIIQSGLDPREYPDLLDSETLYRELSQNA